MQEKNKTKIIVACIGFAGCVIGSIFGAIYGKTDQNQYIESQISNIRGDNNTVTINNVADLVEEYNKLVSENETLEARNVQYFNDLENTVNRNRELESQMADVPDIKYNDMSLSIDGSELLINKNKSMVLINGNKYYSEDIIKCLIPENEALSINKDTIYIGKITYDQTNLSKQWIVNSIYYEECNTSIKDSYGNIRSNGIYGRDSRGEIIYSLKNKYSFLKCMIAVKEDFSINHTVSLIMKADGEVVYSVELNKTTAPYEVEIPINQCSLLTISYDSGTSADSVIIADAILYN